MQPFKPLQLFAAAIFLLFGSWLFAQSPPEAGTSSAATADKPTGTSGEQPSRQSPQTFLQIVFSGGPLGIVIMLVLIAHSIAAVALAVENAILVRTAAIIPPDLSNAVRQLVSEGQIAQAQVICKEEPSFLATVIEHGLAEIDGGWAEVEKAMEDTTAQQAAGLFRRIEYLSVIGNIAPMVGLLGTVSGMLLAFKQVADTEGSAGAAQLADGIYQALVTTVVGLIIAIPALGAFALLRSRVDQLVSEAAYAALHALNPIKQRGVGASPVPPPVAPPNISGPSQKGS